MNGVFGRADRLRAVEADGPALAARWNSAWDAHLGGRMAAGDPRRGLVLREGARADYVALSEHHYRASAPATATRVLVLEVARGWGRRLRTAGFAQDSRDADREVVAVLVESLPSLLCRMRDAALGYRYGNHLDSTERGMLLNEEVRCISRVVVDPRWRGLGLAVRLVRHALETATTPVTEALAAMGRVHPFFERAGMTAYPRPAHEFDTRLVEAFESAGFSRAEFVEPERLLEGLRQAPPHTGRWLRRELRRWFRKTAGRIADRDEPLVQLRTVRERLGLEPVYYAWVREQDG
ncbi:MAG: GNAT family N-acetyltransferase [Planctomycetota bacterium]